MRHGTISRGATCLVAVALWWVGACAGGDAATPELAELVCEWNDSPGNPLIEPPEGEWLIGDPTVLLPEESPDGRWHLFANSLMGIHHHVSDDGLSWERLAPPLFGIGAFRGYIYPEDGRYYMAFEQFLTVESSEIRLSESDDLMTWSEPVALFGPALPWERSTTETVGNPYLMRRDGEYWLYYSAGGVYQEDTGFHEPLHIGLARAPALTGPWTKEPEPLISPSADDPYRNAGAGSLKLLDDPLDGRLVALNNGIYIDGEGRSRSAIRVLESHDGLEWHTICEEPIVAPEGDGWKRAFVYAFDTVRVGDEIRLYYNARDGWAEGTERIGLAVGPAYR